MLVPCRGFCFFNSTQFLSDETENIKCSSPDGGFVFLILIMKAIIMNQKNSARPLSGVLFFKSSKK